MSSVVIKGDTSGSITLQAPAVAGSSLITLASGQTGTINVAGPAFHANAAGTQTLTALASTKILFPTEDFDTNTDFASSRFTPSAAGYYQINSSVRSTISSAPQSSQTTIVKNGVAWSSTTLISTGSPICTFISDIVYCNGTTDYIEIEATLNGGGTITVLSSSFFSGCLIRGA